MSGTMQPPMLPGGAPPMPMGAPPPQGPMPAPNTGAPPPAPPRMAPPGAPGAPPMPPAAGGQGLPASMAPFAKMAGSTNDMQGRANQPGQLRLTPAELGALGRNGDQIVAHLTPGEIAVPPEVQTPKVLATINQAFTQAGADPNAFRAGSPQSSHNPQTGMPEYNFLSSILPMVFGAGASFLAPWALPGLFGAGGALAGGMGQALAGGVGSALGSAVGGGNANQALMAGLGGAAGNLFGGAGQGVAQQAAGVGDAMMPVAQAAANSNPAALAEAAARASAPLGQAAAPSAFSNIGGGDFGALKQAMYTGMGAGVGQSLAPAAARPTTLPRGFNTPMPALNTNYNALLGNTNSPTASFVGYNPIQSVTQTPYNFFAPRAA